MISEAYVNVTLTNLPLVSGQLSAVWVPGLVRLRGGRFGIEGSEPPATPAGRAALPEADRVVRTAPM
jgi:hypothetical protein